MFVRLARMHACCSECGLRYLESPGDPWAFLLVLDRGVFIFPPIVLIYFGWLPESLSLTVLLFATLAGVLIATTPHRYGVCVALDWLVRTRHAPPDEPDSDPAEWDNAAASGLEGDHLGRTGNRTDP